MVITNVGHDHLDTLGPTVQDIARDKADAIRPGVPTLTGATGEALAVISEVAAERGSPLFAIFAMSPDAPQNLFHLPTGTPDMHAGGTEESATRRRHLASERNIRRCHQARAQRQTARSSRTLLAGR